MLVCTDGLTDEPRRRRDRRAARRAEDPQVAAERLVDEAVRRGSRDNVTAVVVDVARRTPATWRARRTARASRGRSRGTRGPTARPTRACHAAVSRRWTDENRLRAGHGPGRHRRRCVTLLPDGCPRRAARTSCGSLDAGPRNADRSPAGAARPGSRGRTAVRHGDARERCGPRDRAWRRHAWRWLSRARPGWWPPRTCRPGPRRSSRTPPPCGWWAARRRRPRSRSRCPSRSCRRPRCGWPCRGRAAGSPPRSRRRPRRGVGARAGPRGPRGCPSSAVSRAAPYPSSTRWPGRRGRRSTSPRRRAAPAAVPDPEPAPAVPSARPGGRGRRARRCRVRRRVRRLR